MKIEQIMRTNAGPERLSHRIGAEVRISSLVPGDVDPALVYEVVNQMGEKIGEVKGERLSFLVERFTTMDLGVIVNALEDGVIIIDNAGRICFENEAYSRIIGVPIRKTIGKSLYTVEPEALLLKVLETGKPLRQERQLVKSVGKYVTMRMYPLMRGSQVMGAFSIFRDVTELNALNREVARMAGVAEEFGSQLSVRNELSRLQIVSHDPKFKQLLSQAATVAPTDATVLIRGENGVGKEVITKFIHQNSKRKDKPFITVNCAAIPDTLIESELFGYEEGAFTGSKKGGKVGKFELAQGGTLFLDEIGDMPYTMQAKLLRVLQEGEIEKIGREETIPVDVRIIAATNQPLESMIADRKFRQDLYFRLNVISLTIPPLRQRRGDIVLLANSFLAKFNEKYGKNVRLSQHAFEQMAAYDWPGNVRQLQNCIESTVIMAMEEVLEDIVLEEGGGSGLGTVAATQSPKIYGALKDEVAKFEQQVIRKVLVQCNGDKEKAIEILGVSRRTFYRKLECQN